MGYKNLGHKQTSKSSEPSVKTHFSTGKKTQTSNT